MTFFSNSQRDLLWPIPFFVLMGGWLGGLSLALGTALGAALSVGNVALLSWIIGRLSASMAIGRSPSAALAVLTFKLVGVMALYGLLMSTMGPLSVVFGLGAVMTGLSARPLIDVLSLPPNSAIQDS